MGILRRALKRPIKRLLNIKAVQRHVCWRSHGGTPTVAITFDDGPDPEWTPRILAILAEQEARASFFLQGNRVEARPDIAATIVAAGHETGNHGYDHARRDGPNQAWLGDRALRHAGITTRLFRPPGGEMGVADLLRLVRAGFTAVMWSFDAVDSLREEGRWTGATPDYADVVAGDIILMHDDNATCARELPALLAALKAKGLQPVTVSELMAFRR